MYTLILAPLTRARAQAAQAIVSPMFTITILNTNIHYFADIFNSSPMKSYGSCLMKYDVTFSHFEAFGIFFKRCFISECPPFSIKNTASCTPYKTLPNFLYFSKESEFKP